MATIKDVMFVLASQVLRKGIIRSFQFKMDFSRSLLNQEVGSPSRYFTKSFTATFSKTKEKREQKPEKSKGSNENKSKGKKRA